MRLNAKKLDQIESKPQNLNRPSPILWICFSIAAITSVLYFQIWDELPWVRGSVGEIPLASNHHVVGKVRKILKSTGIYVTYTYMNIVLFKNELE